MDISSIKSLQNQVVRSLNTLNLDLASSCKDTESKEKELKMLNALYSSLRKTVTYYEQRPSVKSIIRVHPKDSNAFI